MLAILYPCILLEICLITENQTSSGAGLFWNLRGKEAEKSCREKNKLKLDQQEYSIFLTHTPRLFYVQFIFLHLNYQADEK